MCDSFEYKLINMLFRRITFICLLLAGDILLSSNVTNT